MGKGRSMTENKMPDEILCTDKNTWVACGAAFFGSFTRYVRKDLVEQRSTQDTMKTNTKALKTIKYELLPCPWCGSVDIVCGGDDKRVYCRCRNCGGCGPDHYITGMDWNTRADLCERQEASDRTQASLPSPDRTQDTQGPTVKALKTIEDAIAVLTMAASPCDEVCDAAQSAYKAIAQLKAQAAPIRQKAFKTDWVKCPICGETDMRREYISNEEDGPFIFCTNTLCGSNGGTNFSAIENGPTAPKPEAVEGLGDAIRTRVIGRVEVIDGPDMYSLEFETRQHREAYDNAARRYHAMTKGE